MPKLGLNHVEVPHSQRLAALLGDPALRPPEACDWTTYIGVFGDPLGNDAHGNCVPCGAIRAVQMMRAKTGGDIRQPTQDEALALYRAWAGWDGTDATDTGTSSPQAALQWASYGVPWGDAWVDLPSVLPLDFRAPGRLETAVNLLGPVQLDLSIPSRWVSDIDTWDIAPGDASEGRHRVCLGGYDASWLYVVSWGLRKRLSRAALAQWGLAAWASVSRSWLDTMGVTPAGLDYDALAEEGKALASGAMIG